MRKRIVTIFALLLPLALGLTALAQEAPVQMSILIKKAGRQAQDLDKQARKEQKEQQKGQQKAQRDDERARRAEERARRVEKEWGDDEEQAKQPASVVRLKLERGGKLTVSNFSGGIKVVGIDGDTLEAKATEDGELVFLESRVNGSNIALGSESVRGNRRHSGTADIEVKVPRYVSLVQVGSLSGDITVTNVDGDVMTNAVSGDVVIRCVKGHTEAKAVSGSIELTNLSGDVVSETVSGTIVYSGDMRAGGSYRLKSMSGEVEMDVQAEAPGFTATLTTFSGELDTAFPLKIEKSSQYGGNNRQLVGRFGDGGATLSLNSFSGAVRIVKARARAKTSCN